MNPKTIGIAVAAVIGIALAGWIAFRPSATTAPAPHPTEATTAAPEPSAQPKSAPAPKRHWEKLDEDGNKVPPPEGWVPEKKPRPIGPGPSAESLRRAFDAIDYHEAQDPVPGQNQRAFRNAYTDKMRAFSNLDRVLSSVEGDGETEAKLEQVEIRLIMADLSLKAPLSPSEGRSSEEALQKRIRPLYDQATTLLDALEEADPDAAAEIAALRERIPTGSP